MLKLFKRKTDPKKELEAVFGRYELPTFPAIIVPSSEKPLFPIINPIPPIGPPQKTFNFV